MKKNDLRIVTQEEIDAAKEFWEAMKSDNEKDRGWYDRQVEKDYERENRDFYIQQLRNS